MRSRAQNNSINKLPVALLISLYFPPETGGGSTGAWNRALSLHKLGFIVFVLCGFPAFPSGKITDKRYRRKFFYIETQQEINILRMRLPPIKHEGYLRRLVLFISFILLALVYLPAVLHQTGRLSLVYARSPIIFSNVPGICYSKIQGSFYIYEVPDLWPEELSVFQSPFLPLVTKIGKVMAKISYQSSNIVITTSRTSMEYVCQNYRPNRPVFGIPVGVDPSSFTHIDRSHAVHELIRMNVIPPQVEGKFLIVYSGLISAAQNVEVLVHVAKKLESNVDLAFLIIGDGENRSRLEELVVSHNLQNFYLAGWQSRHLMPLIIAAANICTVTLSSDAIFEVVIPSKFYEYLACSKPIIGICRGELANMIEFYDIGYTLRSLEDQDRIVESLIYLINSPERYAELEQNCRDAVTKFSIDAISQKFREIFDKYDEKSPLSH